MTEIVPCSAGWPQEFLRLGRTLRHKLDPLALRIEHISSTSVPGLGAKDVIDLQVTVEEPKPEFSRALARLSYSQVEAATDHVPPGARAQPADWSKWLFKAPRDKRAAQLHVSVVGRPNQRYPLLFRDYLRAHRNAAQSYERVKVALAARHPEDSVADQRVKDPVRDLVMQVPGARAASTAWQPRASDV